MFSAIPVAHSTKRKEEYECIKEVLELLQYKNHEWIIHVDLKMTNFLLGQQTGYKKFPCFLCLEDSRDRRNHWTNKVWEPRLELKEGMPNIINTPLVPREKIIFPPLHIKLGLMKQFTKALDTETVCFKYIIASFPGLSIEKIKAGVFDGPQIRKLLKDTNFVESMTPVQSDAWRSFEQVVKNFLGNKRE